MIRRLAPYAGPLALIVLATGIVALVRLVASVDNAAMLYLLAVLASAILFGSRTAILTAIGSFFAFNFFFVEPRYTLTVAHEDEWVALTLLLVTGVITGQLAAELRNRARRAEEREKEAIVLYDTVRLVSDPRMPDALARLADRLRTELDATAVVITLGDPMNATATAGDGESVALAGLSPPRIMSGGSLPTESHPAKPGRWIKVVGPIRRHFGDQGLAQTTAVRTSDGSNAGSITLVRSQTAQTSSAVDDRLLSTVAHQLGQAMERIRLQHEATDAEVLRRTDEVRTAMMNAVSHDLRTPLASIIATGGNLLARELEWSAEERRELMETIVVEAKRLDHMVGGLLDLSRIEAGALMPNRTLHDLPSLINEAIGRLELAYPEAEFSLQVSPALPPVPLDYVEIEQVMTNLLENAVRHGGGVVSISVTKDAGDVRVCVEDGGPGIAEDDLPHVFRAFEARSGADGGTGLGLAIAKGFVSAHGGRIWAENLRKGARFAFTLPLSVEPARTATQ